MCALPRTVGVGFKPQHFADVMAEFNEKSGNIGFIEVHAENYMAQGGAMRAQLAVLKQHAPVSLHGVGLSLGGADTPCANHLQRLRDLMNWVEPTQFSEHLAWSGRPGLFANDLLPLAYNRDTLQRVSKHVDMVQQALGRQILIENPSSYLAVDNQNATARAETDFLSQLVAETDCGLLLDVNNVYVSCRNMGWNSADYMRALPIDAVGEVHLAGHASELNEHGERVLIDNHGAPISGSVWALYAGLIKRAGQLPTLIEWDTNIPDWSELKAECIKAKAILERVSTAQADKHPSDIVAAE